MVSMASSEELSLASPTGGRFPSLPVAVGRMMDTFVGKGDAGGSPDRLPVVEIRPFMNHEWRPSRSLPDYYDRSMTSMSSSSRRSYCTQPDPTTLGVSNSNSVDLGTKMIVTERTEKTRYRVKEAKHVHSNYPGTFATPLDREKTTVDDLNAPSNPNAQYSCFRRALSEIDLVKQQDMQVEGRKLENMPPKLNMFYMTPWEYYRLNKTYTIPSQAVGLSPAPNTAQSAINELGMRYQALETVYIDDVIYDTFDRSNTLPSIQVSNATVKKKKRSKSPSTCTSLNSALDSSNVLESSIYQLGVANSLDVLKTFGNPSKVETHLTMHLKNTIKHLRRTRVSQAVMSGVTGNHVRGLRLRPGTTPTFGETMLRAGIKANNTQQTSNITNGSKRQTSGPDSHEGPVTGGQPQGPGGPETLPVKDGPRETNHRSNLGHERDHCDSSDKVCMDDAVKVPGHASPGKHRRTKSRQRSKTSCDSVPEETSIPNGHPDTVGRSSRKGTSLDPPTTGREGGDPAEMTEGVVTESLAGVLQPVEVPLYSNADDRETHAVTSEENTSGGQGADQAENGGKSLISFKVVDKPYEDPINPEASGNVIDGDPVVDAVGSNHMINTEILRQKAKMEADKVEPSTPSDIPQTGQAEMSKDEVDAEGETFEAGEAVKIVSESNFTSNIELQSVGMKSILESPIISANSTRGGENQLGLQNGEVSHEQEGDATQILDGEVSQVQVEKATVPDRKSTSEVGLEKYTSTGTPGGLVSVKQEHTIIDHSVGQEAQDDVFLGGDTRTHNVNIENLDNSDLSLVHKTEGVLNSASNGRSKSQSTASVASQDSFNGERTYITTWDQKTDADADSITRPESILTRDNIHDL